MLLHFILFMFIFPLTLVVGTFHGTATNNTINPNCQTHCGDVIVPFPFGIGMDCSLDDSFNLTCDTSSFKSPKLFIGNGNIQIYNISNTELRTPTLVASNCYNQSGYVDGYTISTNLTMLRAFTFSAKNKFTVIGCDDYAWVKGTNEDGFTSGCFGLCQKAPHVPDGQCSGIGCCQIPMPKGLSYYNATLYSFLDHSDILSFNECGYGFLVEEGAYKFRNTDLSTNHLEFIDMIESTMPLVLDWVIPHKGNCSAEVNKCKGNSSSYDVEGGRGYRCKCHDGYEGNPYLHLGCQDIDECKDQGTNPCHGNICTNTIGSYYCTCEQGYHGDASILNGCQPAAKGPKFSSTILVIVVLSSMLAILSGIALICLGIRRKKLTRLREKFFEQNGGALLKQKLKSQRPHDTMTLFSTEQLRKATDNYSQEKIIGKGAYGVVYKGVLSDKRVVAIKKSKVVDETQSEQFINEVLMLTQVIHRNVVKLLGCCLEEEVPVLVYEFISNNTLFYHIHHKSGGMNWLSWENRLRVATEAASALGYLHSEITMPIVHRDVKSANILLDENYTAKISDFGASRLVPVDHDQVSTLIQGTLGYLDPEYFNLSQLTEKSDVYSFGVVLAELITGKKKNQLVRTEPTKKRF